MEIQYPTLPIIGTTITENSTLPEYVVYFFTLGITIAGILAVISFAVGAIRLIMSAVNPESAKDAKDQMKGSALGLVFLLVSFLILRTINPALTTPTLTPLPGTAGVFYIKENDRKPTPNSEADTSALVAQGYTKIFYDCVGGTGPDIFIWKYPNKNFMANDQDFAALHIVRKKCGEEETIKFYSFKWAYVTPGVYYFTQPDCNMDNANMSGANLATENTAYFNVNIKSIKIINDPAKDEYYGFIAHKNALGQEGPCELPVLEGGCTNIEKITAVSSVDIFQWNKDAPETSGSGVTFYSKPWGWKTGALGGSISISSEDALFGIGQLWKEFPSKIKFDYTGTNVGNDYIKENQNFYDSTSAGNGSIEMNGTYVIALYAQSPKVENEPFYNQDTNLSAAPVYCDVYYDADIYQYGQTIFPVGFRDLRLIYVIPSK